MGALDMPAVMTEWETIEYAWNKKVSLSRYGDGELRIALGGDSVTQRERHAKLQQEMHDGLVRSTKGVLTCIPHPTMVSPKAENWKTYFQPAYANLYRQAVYGSSLITRPDSAPWINRWDYWDYVTKFWTGLDVVLVRGEESRFGIDTPMLTAARSVSAVIGPTTNAYAQIDEIEARTRAAVAAQAAASKKGRWLGPVIMCLGATATVLATRLGGSGIWALDLGHMGKYMPKEFFYKERVSHD